MLQRAPLSSNARRARVSRSAIIPAPVGGWDASSALAAMPKERAVKLENWFPQPGWVEVRRGYDYHAWDIVSDTTPVQTLMSWQGQASSKMFAAAGTDFYNITSEGAATAQSLTMTNSRWQWVNMTNSGNTYLYAVNGVDEPIHYNGSSWVEPTITGVTATTLVNINVHKKRLWFCAVDSTKAWYLAVDAISGAATSFELGSTFSRGGYLMAMATWTRDGGSGSDDYAVFVSSRGQVTIFQGTDPSSASTWALVGVFDVPAPIGRRCFTKFGADVLLVTVEGLFPLSQILSVDSSQTQRLALTANIQNAMVDATRDHADNYGWEACVYSKGTRLILNVPHQENVEAEQYVMNTLTGAWCKFTNHNANCWLVFNDRLFFGGNDGAVYEADSGSADVATPITAIGETAYQHFQSPGKTKRATMVQPLITASGVNRPSLGISVDFQETSELSTPNVETNIDGLVWDEGEWDSESWAGTTQQINDWISVPALGRFLSMKFQAQTGLESQAAGVGSYWGISQWGDPWGGTEFSADETMRLNGAVVLYEIGEYL